MSERGQGEERCCGQRVGPFGTLEQERLQPRVACSPVSERGQGEERCFGQRVGPFGPLEQERSWLMRRLVLGPGHCQAPLRSAGGAELFGFETISRGAKGRQAHQKS